MSRVVIAGAGALGRALATKLAIAHDVRAVRQSGELPAPSERLTWYQADLTTIPGAELALTGAHTVVLLAQARRVPARLARASLDDLDRLLADSVARAALLVGVKHLVVYACGDDDARLALLEKSGVPLSVLRGGAPDPVELLAAMVGSAPGAHSTTPAWGGTSAEVRPPSIPTCSVQRYPRPPGWSALDIVRGYFRWLPTGVPLVKTTEHEGVFTITMAGVRALVLRLEPGRSSADSAWLTVADGALAGRSTDDARFEFRVLLDGVTAMVAQIGFHPSLPWPVYRFSQALVHERVMRRFGEWLAQQKGPPP
ncbi:MAG: hypothetical protein Q8L48_12720 [Archangium sp.]|nr:hypothetical protein [Archangium sp.]